MSTPSGEKEGDERLKLVHCNTTAGPGRVLPGAPHREHPSIRHVPPWLSTRTQHCQDCLWEASVQGVKLSLTDASAPCGFWFKSRLLHLRSSSGKAGGRPKPWATVPA